jgi:hypothetical protein
MKSITYEATAHREVAKKFFSTLKEEGKKIIDIGASMSDWTSPFVDAIVDINTPQTNEKIFFQGNICNTDVWDKVEQYVSENGKFDFSICSHTLEDISSPYMVCKKIEKISKAGVIMIPSKYYELSKVESHYKGWIHHRWIWNIENNELVGYPKNGFVEYMDQFDTLANQGNQGNTQIVLYWEENIPIKIVNDDFLGPSVDHVIGYYQNLLN